MSREHPVHGAEEVLARLRGLPGGPELLAQARRRGDVALVGGAVRDLLLGHWPQELDVTVARDAAGLAEALAAAVSPSERAYGRAVEQIFHDRFGTASVNWQYGRIDVAERRAESYPAPGALPEVRPGSYEEDLRRRDFTVNAIALPLEGPEAEGLLAVEGALDDLHAGRLRVLHDRSFLDDPTRIMRLARYAARLGFDIEPHTRELASRAVAEGALATVSGGRLGAELWLAAQEDTGVGALLVLDGLGALAALGMTSPFAERLARDALALLPQDGAPDVLLLGVALHRPGVGGDPEATLAVMERLAFSREQAAAVQDPANRAGELAALLTAGGPAEAHAALDGHSLEAAALAAVLAASSSPEGHRRAIDWLSTQRHVRLEIDGGDLLAAGVPEGPEVGRRLRAALARKREGLTRGRAEELQAALDADPAPAAAVEAAGQ